MGFLMAAIYDRFMAGTEEACLAAWRSELVRGARGRVLEVGAGTGANLPFYGREVERLVLAEPDRHMRAQLAARASGVALLEAPVETSDASADRLPFGDAAFDVVVSTLVLCSVGSLEGSLAEIRRVLAPGGALIFLEHVAAEDRPERLRWQRRVEPVWRRVAGNCHLARRTEAGIVAAGFALEEVSRESIRKAMPLARPSVRGVARKPA